MNRSRRIHFVASHAGEAQEAMAALQGAYGQSDLGDADVIVALGGDGFMLRTLHRFQATACPDSWIWGQPSAFPAR